VKQPRWILLAGLLLVPLAFGISLAQSGGEATPEASSRLGPDELDELMAPIALYPDEMVALVLPASTQPFELMEASRYLATVKGEVPEKVDVDWDDSVKELLYYPDILHMLNKDLDWTTKLGQAVRVQMGDVMDAIQRLRHEAERLGNLANLEGVRIEHDGDDILILLEDEEEMVVPDYDYHVIYTTGGYVWRRWWRWPCWRWRAYRCWWRRPRAVHYALRPADPRYRGRKNRPVAWHPNAQYRPKPGAPPRTPRPAGVKPARTTAQTSAARSSQAQRAAAAQRRSSFQRTQRASQAQKNSYRGAQSRTHKKQYRSSQRRSSNAYHRNYNASRARSYGSRGRASRGGGGRGGGGRR
jgi:hypothetical protein